MITEELIGKVLTLPSGEYLIKSAEPLQAQAAILINKDLCTITFAEAFKIIANDDVE